MDVYHPYMCTLADFFIYRGNNSVPLQQATSYGTLESIFADLEASDDPFRLEVHFIVAEEDLPDCSTFYFEMQIQTYYVARGSLACPDPPPTIQPLPPTMLSIFPGTCHPHELT